VRKRQAREKEREIERETRTQSWGRGQKFPLGYFWPFLGNVPRSHFLPCPPTCPLFLKVGNPSKSKCRAGAMLGYRGRCCPASWQPPPALDRCHGRKVLGQTLRPLHSGTRCPPHLRDPVQIPHGQIPQPGGKQRGEPGAAPHPAWPPATGKPSSPR